MRTFLLKAKHFFKRNIYPITITMCSVLVLGIITVSAYSSIKNSNNQTTQTNNQIIVENDKVVESNGGKEPPAASKPNDEQNKQPSKPVETKIVFEFPLDNATKLKEYTETTLVYDATTKLWCTHQAIDFSAIEGQEVKSVYDGEILKVESSMMYGTVVYLKVSNEITVVYKGLSSEINVKEGDKVKKGQVIGKITSFLAEKADGIHLHLELFKNDKISDPNEYFSFNK